MGRVGRFDFIVYPARIVFVADAKPPRTKILWVLPGPRASSAYGYPQAKDGTWGDYRRDTSSYLAERDNFRMPLILWVGTSIVRIGSLVSRKSDAYRHYLAYHEVLVAFSAVL